MAEMHAQRRPVALLVKTWPKISETFILEEILGLERSGQPLHIFALQPPTDAIRHQAVDRVEAPAACLPEVSARHLAALLGAHMRLLLRRPARYLDALRRALSRRGALPDFLRAGWLVYEAQSRGIAHLHAHFLSRPADIAEHAGALGLPFSLSAHAKDIYLSAPTELRRKLNAARFTVTCTEYNRQTLADIAPRARIARMYHGVDLARFNPALRSSPDDPPLILAVGRLREKKGFDTLIEACRRLRRRGIDFRCEIVGYGELQGALNQQIQDDGLGAVIRLTGKLPREAVIDRYARATVFVQPSRIALDGDRDGIPNVLLEAMAMQLPVVTTRVSGIPELVTDGRNGLLISPDRPADLADALSELLAVPRLRTRLGAAAREAVRARFDNDHNLKLLSSLLGNPHECSRDATVAPAAGSAAGAR